VFANTTGSGEEGTGDIDDTVDDGGGSEVEGGSGIADLEFSVCGQGDGQKVRKCIEGVHAAGGTDDWLDCEQGGGSDEVWIAVAHCVDAHGCCGDWESVGDQLLEMFGVVGKDAASEGMCGMGECKAMDNMVEMQVKLPYTVSEFDEAKQQQFVQVVADAASVAVPLVSIVSISALNRRAGLRVLLEGNIQVDVEIAVASKAAAEALASSDDLKAESLNANIEAELGVQAEILKVPQAASKEVVGDIPEPEDNSAARMCAVSAVFGISLALAMSQMH